MEAECTKLNDYFGYFFIRKCVWLTPATIKNNQERWLVECAR